MGCRLRMRGRRCLGAWVWLPLLLVPLRVGAVPGALRGARDARKKPPETAVLRPKVGKISKTYRKADEMQGTERGGEHASRSHILASGRASYGKNEKGHSVPAVLQRSRKRDPLGLYIVKDSLRARMAKTARFGPYANNFFMLGMPIDRRPTRENSGVMFQISIQQRLFRRPLFWNSNLFISYTQYSFWDIFQESSPFQDNNYNPALHAAVPFMLRGYFAGMVDLAFEHLSNGRAGLESRSLNYVSLRVKYYPHILFMVDVKAWVPFLYKEDNPDYFSYAGYCSAGVVFRYPAWGLRASLYVNPSDKFRNYNVTYELGCSPWENYTIYFFLRGYMGYAERLLDYREYTCNLRVGIALTPSFMQFH